jgi:hypothetical protein
MSIGAFEGVRVVAGNQIDPRVQAQELEYYS